MKFYREATSYTPEVILDEVNQKLTITGRSYDKKSYEFYKIILDAIDKLNCSHLDVTLNLEYLNTSSVKCVYKLLKLISDKFATKVIWFYDEDDYDMEELGHYYAEVLKLKINFMENSEC